jgi:hypothetical protein
VTGVTIMRHALPHSERPARYGRGGVRAVAVVSVIVVLGLVQDLCLFPAMP